MFTLGIYDKLTPGARPAALHVAGTGTIADDGTVGAIGGIQQKMAAARRAGATVFLVPAGNCAEARAAAPDGLRLVKVTDVRRRAGQPYVLSRRGQQHRDGAARR